MTNSDAEIVFPPPVPEAAGPGALLRQAREAAGLDIGALALRLHLKADLLESLEANRFDRLTQPTYVRGYLRAAAKELGVDERPLLDAYAGLKPAESALEPPTRLQQPFHEPRGKRTVVYAAAILLALLLLSLFGYRLVSEWMGDAGEEAVLSESGPSGLRTLPLPTPMGEALPDGLRRIQDMPGDIEADVPEPERDGGADEPPEAGSALTPDTAGTVEPEHEAATEAMSLPTESLPAHDTLRLVLRGDSWVEVRDADGQRLLADLLRTGVERVVEGRAPMRVVIGNADGVSAEFNGQPVDLARYIGRDRVARLILPAE